MAAQILQELTPKLVTAFSPRIQPLLDQFLAKGLITGEAYDGILESTSSSKVKARNMLSAIKDVVGTEDNCFLTVLSILKEAFGNEDKLVLDMQDQYLLKYPPPPKRLRLRRAYSDPTILLSANRECLADDPEFDSVRRHTVVLPEVRVIQFFTPELVNALRASVDNASDECLARGIIPESLHRKLLECTSGEDKVRKLLQCIRSSITVDNRCYRIFLSILKSTVPSAITEKLLSAIKEKYKELSKAAENLDVDVAGDCLVKEFESPESDTSSNFKLAVDQFRDAVEKHTRACVEKETLQKELERKQKEKEELKKGLETALVAGGSDNENVKKLRGKIAACESKFEEIEVSVAKLDKNIEEYRMNEKREESCTQEEYMDITDSQREAQLVIDHFHSQLHSRHCQCLKDGTTAFIAKYL